MKFYWAFLTVAALSLAYLWVEISYLEMNLEAPIVQSSR